MPDSTSSPRESVLRLLDRIPEGRVLAGVLAVSLVFTLVAGVASDSVFQIDEHFQVVEFAGHKLGTTSASELLWEFSTRIRPWTQPGAYALLARGLQRAGVESPFVLLRAFRVASGILSWAALAALLLAVRHLLTDRWRKAAYLSLGLPYFVPFLAARVSSESASTTFLVLAVAALLAPAADEAGGSGPASWRHLASGTALGMAFECRYQAGIVAAGIVLWVLVHARERWRKLLLVGLGMAPALAFGLWVDAWGYGAFEIVPWNYLRSNLLEGKASVFGTMPFFAYPGLMAALFPPFGLVLMVGMGLFWWRFPRHLLTWATLPFFLVHSLVGHKEIRFLFPILPLATVCLVLMWARPAAPRPWEGRLLGWMRALWFSRVTWSLDALALCVVCMLPSTDNVELNRYFYDHAGDPVSWVALSDPRTLHGAYAPFLVPRPSPPVTMVRDTVELERALAEASGTVLVTAKFPLPEGAAALLQRRGRLVFTSLPPWLARLNLFDWVERADLMYVYRVEARAAPVDEPRSPVR